LGVDLDRVGVTTAAVHGNHFTSYLRFFGHGGLDIPTAVLTDYDGGAGAERIRRLLAVVFRVEAEEAEVSTEATREIGARHGLFLGESTLESDLLAAGQGRAIGETLIELGTTRPARHCGGRLKSGEEVSSDTVLAHIKAIGKGRFAQRLAGNLVSRPDCVPRYIASAIDHLRSSNP
jgi:putative ATP-dependent endonuclease of OLD family